MISVKQLLRIDLTELPTVGPMAQHDFIFLAQNPNFEQAVDFWAGCQNSGHDLTQEEMDKHITQLCYLALAVQRLKEVLPHSNKMSRTYRTHVAKPIVEIYDKADLDRKSDVPPQPLVSIEGVDLAEVATLMCLVYTQQFWFDAFMKADLVKKVLDAKDLGVSTRSNQLYC